MALVKNILSIRPHIDFSHAYTAREGIALAESVVPDLIMMDIHLPGMDGLEAFKILQKNASTQSIPVVALSADAMDTDIQKAIKMGIHSYITKPIQIPEFLKTIDKVLENKT